MPCLILYAGELVLWGATLWDPRVPAPLHTFDQLSSGSGGAGGIFHPNGGEIILNSEVGALEDNNNGMPRHFGGGCCLRCVHACFDCQVYCVACVAGCLTTAARVTTVQEVPPLCRAGRIVQGVRAAYHVP